MFDRPALFDGLLDTQETVPCNSKMAAWIKDKVVMVTGAGGTVGASLSLQLALLNPSIIILLDRSEQALSNIEKQLRSQLEARGDENCIKLVPIHSTVSNSTLTEIAFRRYNISVVFHAAADKQVVMLERDVVAGIQNNIFATSALARMAEEYGVSDFVLISTNKAGNPVNVLGATKRIAEQLLLTQVQKKSVTRFSIVRFGNVMGAPGSVLPLFQQQILSGGPVTVTHPEIRRSFIKVSDAATLIIHAGAIARGGEVFCLGMPKPVRIADMARRLIGLMGYTVCVESDGHHCCCKNAVHIHYTGLRNGESLSEEKPAFTKMLATSHPQIFRLVDSCYSETALDIIIKQLEQACTVKDNDLARTLLARAVVGLDDNRTAKSLPADNSLQSPGELVATLNP